MRVSTIVLATVLIAAGAGVHAAATNISQSGQKFSEKSIDLKPGDFLNFQNQDDVSHNITVLNDNDDATDLGLQKPGETVKYAFDKAGRFKIRCSIHPSMKMTVTVK